MKMTAFLLLLFSALPGAHAETHHWVLSGEAWARPKDGHSVTRLPLLAEVINRWSESAGQRIPIRYRGGEEGLLWAHELRSWLVALGVPLSDQELVAGTHRAR